MKILRMVALALAAVIGGACNAIDATAPTASEPAYECSGSTTGTGNTTGCP